MKNLVTVLVLAMVGCASTSGAPDWVSGTAARYPAAQYLVGRGQAASGEEARDRARADLAKIFEVNVAVESEDVQSFRRHAGDSESDGEYEERSARRVVARTDRLLEGVAIAETWQDPDTKTQYALAALPRLKASMALRQEIDRLDQATRLDVDRARAAPDLLLKIAAAARALAAQSERAAHQKTLRIVDATGQGEQSSWSLARLRADLDALLKRVKVAPRVASDASNGLASVTQGALAAAGFLADTGEQPEYVLETSLALDDLGKQDGWYWQRGTLELRFIESANQRVRGTRRWPIKSSALAHDGAVQRALDAADAILKKELRTTIIGFAAGAEEK